MEKPSPVQVLIVDDEPAAHVRLEDLLSKEPDFEVMGTARSGREAIRAIRKHTPGLVFLDIQMPGLSGLDVIREIGPSRMPMVIFVTAYDQYAQKAFDLAAVDYLLKPFNDDRFRESLSRVRELLRHRKLDEIRDRLTALIDHMSAPGPAPYLERIAVEMRGQMLIVPVERIDYIMASGAYARVHVGDETYLVNEQMQALEDRLDPEQFVRIHRSTIVRLNQIESLLVGAGADYTACLADGSRLKVSRRRWDYLVQQLGIKEQAK